MKYSRIRIAGVVAITIILCLTGIALLASSGGGEYLKTGRFRPSFDHLGAVERQIDAVAASGCTVTYAGLGGRTYLGLLAKGEMQKFLDGIKAYNSRGHLRGVPVILSYLCATSICNAKTFTENWKDFAPDLPVGIDATTLLQQDINGNNLPSWYGDPYNPADTWNPIWRQYHKFLIKLVIQSGHDGVFYDNPTVHANGNYSQYAMCAWCRFLKKSGVTVPEESTASLRELTKSNQKLWMQFRATEVADFLREMRDYGRSLKPDFILTANNSLNIWDSFYDQPRTLGYNIFNMSQSQDFVTVEDMSFSPRRDATGYVSYGSTLRMIHAIGHGKPVSVTTIANNSYTTPAEMMQLAIAECTAHDTAYMVWACWDEPYKQAMERSVKQYHDFLDSHPDLFANTQPVSDVAFIWPYDNWLQRSDCPTAYLAQYLSAANVQYDPITEGDLTPAKLREYKCAVWVNSEPPQKPQTQKMLSEFTKSGGKAFGLSTDQLNLAIPDKQQDSTLAGTGSVSLAGVKGVRATARRAKSACILNLYNLNVVWKDAYHDEVEPAGKVDVSWLLPKGMKSKGLKLKCFTPDTDATSGNLAFKQSVVGDRILLKFTVPRLYIWSVIRAVSGGK